MVCPGLFSNIMRNLANEGGDGPKWIVLDGDIDPMWIESLNTVMDDNKVCLFRQLIPATYFHFTTWTLSCFTSNATLLTSH